jgi:ribonuclease III
MNTRTTAVAELEQTLGYTFTDKGKLERALTHASVGDGARKTGDNERLEFLGDRVLGLLTAERLIEVDPHATEGDLAPRLNALVNRAACARVARRMRVGPALRLSGAETKAGGRDKDSILAGACEALMAALYEDGGLEAARAVFLTFWVEEFGAISAPRPKDPKTRLQEWAQSKARPLPAYRVLDRQGPEHAPIFTVEAVVEGVLPAAASGTSRQAAEKAAAQALLDREGVV